MFDRLAYPEDLRAIMTSALVRSGGLMFEAVACIAGRSVRVRRGLLTATTHDLRICQSSARPHGRSGISSGKSAAVPQGLCRRCGAGHAAARNPHGRARRAAPSRTSTVQGKNMGRQIEELATFVATTRWEDIPEPVRNQTRMVFLDTLGVILAGHNRPEVKALQQNLAPTAGSGATVYAAGWPSADPRTAALLNGISGRAIELCEGVRLASGQCAMQVLPGILAVGEQKKSSGREILAALTLGYDAAARLCAAFVARPLAHQNGQASLLGAVAAGARLHGFDGAGVSHAMRIATTLLMTPAYTNVVAGATTLNVPGGMSGFAAALAPELALAGFGAQADAIEEALGKMVGDGFKVDTLVDELGMRWDITRNYFRLYACCNPIHPSLDCLAAVLAEHKPAPEAIEKIDFVTYGFASVMRNPAPPNYFASKYSLPHAAAAMIVRGHAGFSALDDSALQDPVIAGLRPLVNIVEDPAMTARLPRYKPARVTVTLRDGTVLGHEVESHRGDFFQPFAESELRAKFRELAGTSLTAAGVAAVEKAVDRCEEWTSLDELTSLLRTHSRA
jgi:2-methylcitrate dehydratase PrpD